MSTGNKKGGKKGKGGNKGGDQEKQENPGDVNPSTETTNDAPQEEKKVEEGESTTAATTEIQSDAGSHSTTATTEPAPTQENTQSTETKPENPPSETKPNLSIDIADPNSSTPQKDQTAESVPEKLASPKVEAPPKESPKKPETPKKAETPKKTEPVIIEKTPEKKEPEPVAQQANVNATSEKKEVPKVASPETSSKKEDEPVIIENNSLNKSWQVVDKDQSIDTASDRAQDGDDSKSDTFSVSSRPSIDSSAKKPENDQHNAHERLEKADKIYKLAVKNRESGEYQIAVQNLHEAVETLDPKYFKPEDTQRVKEKIYEYTCEISSTYLQQKNYGEAIKYAQSVKNNAVNNVKALYLLGQAYAGKNENQEALNCFQQVKTIKEPQDKALVKLCEQEIERLEKLKKSAEQPKPTSSTPAQSQVEPPKPAANKTPEESKTEPVAPKKDENTEPNVGIQLLGGFIGTSALAFVTSKFVLKQPLNKSLIAAGVLGVVGAITQYFMDKGSSEDKKKK